MVDRRVESQYTNTKAVSVHCITAVHYCNYLKQRSMYHFPSENNKELDQLQRQLRDEEASHDNTREELKEEKASHQKVKDELTDTKMRTEDKLAGKSHWKYDIVQSCTHKFTFFLFVYVKIWLVCTISFISNTPWNFLRLDISYWWKVHYITRASGDAIPAWHQVSWMFACHGGRLSKWSLAWTMLSHSLSEWLLMIME